VEIARADGKVTDEELKLLHRVGNNMGLTDPEIDDLLASAKKPEYIPPYELAGRFDDLFCIVRMMMADGHADRAELDLAGKFAVKSGFVTGEIPGLLELMIRGVEEGADVDDLFGQYRKARKSGRN